MSPITSTEALPASHAEPCREATRPAAGGGLAADRGAVVCPPRRGAAPARTLGAHMRATPPCDPTPAVVRPSPSAAPHAVLTRSRSSDPVSRAALTQSLVLC
jgi:hypothetical protein